MMWLWIWIAVYLGGGLLLLVLFDFLTGRLRSGWKDAIAESQNKLSESGSPVGARTVIVLTIGAVWLFWPFVFIGAVTPKKEGRK